MWGGDKTFQLQLSDIFLLSVNQYPLVSLGHVINCIAEYILEQTASFKSLSFSLCLCIFCKYLFVCKGTSGSLGYPHGQESEFCAMPRPLLEHGACVELVTTFVCTLVGFNIFIHPNPERYEVF